MENQKHIGSLIKWIDLSIKNELNKQLEQYGITLVQLQTLAYIHWKKLKSEDVFQKDLEEHLYLTNPTVTGIVKRLESKNLIRRIQSNGDARYKSLYITAEGEEVLQATKDTGLNVIEERLTADLTKQEVELLEHLLSRVLNSIKK